MRVRAGFGLDLVGPLTTLSRSMKVMSFAEQLFFIKAFQPSISSLVTWLIYTFAPKQSFIIIGQLSEVIRFQMGMITNEQDLEWAHTPTHLLRSYTLLCKVFLQK